MAKRWGVSYEERPAVDGLAGRSVGSAHLSHYPHGAQEDAEIAQ